MEINIVSVDDFLCKARFSLPLYEIDDILDSLGIDSLDNDFDKKTFYHFIEENIITNHLIEKSIVPLKTKKFYYYNEYNETMPLIGIVFFTKMPSKVEFTIPAQIPDYINDKIKLMENNDEFLKKELKKSLISIGICESIEDNVVSENSIIYYKKNIYLCESNEAITDGEIFDYNLNGIYSKNNKPKRYKASSVSNINDKIDKNIKFYKDLFMGKKLNDKLILTRDDLDIDKLKMISDCKLDEVNYIELEILNITNMVPYTNENDEECVKKIKSLGYRKFSKLEEDFKDAYLSKYMIDTYLEYIVGFLYEKKELEISDKVLDFYKDYYINEKDKHEDFEKFVTLKFLLDFLQRAIELKISDGENSLPAPEIMTLVFTNNPLHFFARVGLIDGAILFDYLVYLLILNYYKENNIIKGLDL